MVVHCYVARPGKNVERVLRRVTSSRCGKKEEKKKGKSRVKVWPLLAFPKKGEPKISGARGAALSSNIDGESSTIGRHRYSI